MKQSKDSFIHELSIKVSPSEDKVLLKRLNAGRQLYNACLGESLRRLKLLRESKAWQRARRERDNKKRRQIFKEAIRAYEFQEYSIHAYVKGIRNGSHIKEHIDSSTAQKIATRAFDAAQKYSFRTRGAPRFKGVGRFRTIEGKSNATGLRFRDGAIEWSGLRFKCIYDQKDKYGTQAYALSKDVKYVRLLYRVIKGKRRWYIQLILEGTPHIKVKNRSPEGVVGLDVGPSTIAVVSDKDSFLLPFCPELKSYQTKIKSLQRSMARSRKLTNPDNYEASGVAKKGALRWRRSKRYVRLQYECSELQRIMAATRKASHGKLSNDILKLGNKIKTEKLSIRSFQKNFGKSVGFRAPGKLLLEVKRKAENAAGTFYEFSTLKTKLSQICHNCGKTRKKALSERWHRCDCGISSQQRDLYCAYLSKYVENDSLNIKEAQGAFSGAESLLERAVFRANQVVSREHRLSSLGLSALRQNDSHVKDDVSEQLSLIGIKDNTLDAVTSL